MTHPYNLGPLATLEELADRLDLLEHHNGPAPDAPGANTLVGPPAAPEVG